MEGLAAQMVYGNGEGQNTKHFYAGANAVKKRKKCRKKTAKNKK